jgi:phenylalanine-4-hydroxylase
MRQNVDFLSKHAYEKYIQGLRDTGISIEKIPDMETMNNILSKIGWAAVAVDGFIPPAAFMEFQAHNVLVIAADIRTIDQIEYTPAPDIIHEAAGHAPIIADPEYAAYLKYFGEIGSKAFSSSSDYELYEAIRHLSILKADPNTHHDEISEAETELSIKEKSMGIPSEMALIRNLHWWTVEYGLIGEIENPKIYGAGLLSSIGESLNVFNTDVEKIAYSIDAVDYNFDITKPQPQLFVTPDFKYLTQVLDEFVNRMAVSKGGIEGLLKAIESKNTATCVLSSGLEISGTFTDYLLHQNQIAYFRTTGPTTLNYHNKMLVGHGKNYHNDGFGSPVGKIKNTKKPPRLLSDSDLKEVGIVIGQSVDFSFESGITVSGILKTITRIENSLVLMCFTDCLVSYHEDILFKPEWGPFDMAVGEYIISAYNGPADPDGFGVGFTPPKEKTHKILHSDSQLRLFELYGEIRNIREEKIKFERIPFVWQTLKNDYENDWLLSVELVELMQNNHIFAEIVTEIIDSLGELINRKPALKSLIEKGLKLK